LAFRKHRLGRGQQLAFQHDLGIRRQRQAGQRARQNVERRTLDRAGEVEFRLAIR
jgi:hypothetical protein